ncbi:retrovirus-related pol polyprotein from transposon TNT 1-94 [Tanacetum coccineum]|uniref:Retrovirus-related pol polyprotein from transposon TNT 1-94 n=1 Tax=Tanacetum coccineum TaxID=301880 RepID=A0ABQ4XLA9_9ASTR
MKIEESLNVTFDETPPPSETSPLVDDDLDEVEAIKVTEKKNLENDIEDEILEVDKIVNTKESKNHLLKNELVPHPKSTTIIGTKWVYKNKLDENGVVSRNKARLVAQGYNQQAGIDYDETYALVARLESIGMLLAYAYALDFKLFQMDVKSAFLNGFINEEVYVAQPPGFIDFEKPNHVYKLKKALYGLKQLLKLGSDLIIVQIYVDGIIFDSTCQELCDDFAKIMHDEFEISMMGELNFFLGLQIKQMEDGIFFNQYTYIKEMLKKFGLEDSKPMKTPMSSDTKLMKDEECLISYLMSAFVHTSKRIPKPLILKRLSVSSDTLKTRKDYGTKRGCHSTSASSASDFDHPSSSHHVYDDNDENDEGTSRASTPSPTRFVNSLSNEIPQVFSNPPDDEQTMQNLFTRQTKILNPQIQMRGEYQSGLRSIEKGIKNLWKGKKK